MDKVDFKISELWWRESVNTSLLVLFSSGHTLEISFFDIKDRNVFINDFLVSALKDLNNYISVFTLESIVIFRWNMHSKFWLSLLVGDNVL